MMKETLKLSDTNDRKRITDLLRQGKVGLFPTDTVFGICCRMDRRESVERIFEIKKREKNKPFLVLTSSLLIVEKFIDTNLTDEKKRILEKYWPGPLTVVFKAKKDNVESTVRADGETLAIRIPDYKEIREIIDSLKVPIVAPSANISGGIAPSYLKDVDPDIINGVDFIVDGECKIKSASTIVDITQDKLVILREGALKIS